MKQIIAVCISLLALFSLAGCSQDRQDYLHDNSENIYDAVLLPETITFGMDSTELGKLLELDVQEGGRKEFSVLPSIKLNNNCSIFMIDYTLYDEQSVEFEDNTELVYVTYTIIDLVPSEKRTSEWHGDIAAEYDAIKNHFLNLFGKPFVSEKGNDLSYIKKITWIDKDGMGITLTLNSLTKGMDEGKITIRYADTTKLKDDWYENA